MNERYTWYERRGISRQVFDCSEKALEKVQDAFLDVDRVREKRQLEVLDAFAASYVSESAFIHKTGYGYDDAGREQTEAVFARALGAEDALVRTQLPQAPMCSPPAFAHFYPRATNFSSSRAPPMTPSG